MWRYWFQQASIFSSEEIRNLATIEVSPEKKLLQWLASNKQLFELGLVIEVNANSGIPQEGFIL